MYKATVELCRIHPSLSLKVGIILEEDELQKLKNRNMNYGAEEMIRKFTYRGNSYIRINPRPFLTIDITNKKLKKANGYDPNYQMSLGQRGVFSLKRGLRQLISEFQSEKELFYYKGNDLLVDNILADAHRKVIPIGNGKSIILHPCVVQDEEERDQFYEGCFMAFNKVEYFVYMTYEEMLFLLDTLTNLDMISIAMHIIDTEILYTGLREHGRGDELYAEEPVKETQEIDPSPNYKAISNQTTIPKI